MADNGAEYELVEFHNGSDFDLNMTWAGRSYGTAPAHETVKVVRFVAEHWARRNEKFQLVEDSPVAQEIEKEKKETGAAEVLDRKRVEAETKALEEDAKLAARIKKAEADKVLATEAEADPVVEDEPKPLDLQASK